MHQIPWELWHEKNEKSFTLHTWIIHTYTIHAYVVDTSVNSGAVWLVIRERDPQQLRRKHEKEKKKLSSLFLSNLAPKELSFISLQLVFSLSHLQVALSYLQRAGGAGGTLRHAGSHLTAKFPCPHLRKPQGPQVVLEGLLATFADCTGSVCLLFCLTDWTLEE